MRILKYVLALIVIAVLILVVVVGGTGLIAGIAMTSPDHLLSGMSQVPLIPIYWSWLRMLLAGKRPLGDATFWSLMAMCVGFQVMRYFLI